ncbi:uncharacterized protein [Aristolochia californica]|uniref:uncharacterized protein n=1 Tax=Aristolochia californica TaxID=171875 RepID=UPI0035E11AD6
MNLNPKGSLKFSNLASWLSLLPFFYFGNGNTLKFWNNWWVGQTPLKNSFPVIFGLTGNQEINISDSLSENGDWNLNLKRHLTDEKALLASQLLLTLPRRQMDTSDDTLIWTPCPKGSFTSSSAYALLNNIPDHPKHPTRHLNLRSSLPILHKSHVLLSCQFAYQVWTNLLNKIGHQFCASRNLADAILSLVNSQLPKLGKMIISCCIGHIIWVLWKERNKRKFKFKFCSIEVLSDQIASQVSVWLLNEKEFKKFSASNFMGN